MRDSLLVHVRDALEKLVHHLSDQMDALGVACAILILVTLFLVPPGQRCRHEVRNQVQILLARRGLLLRLSAT